MLLWPFSYLRNEFGFSIYRYSSFATRLKSIPHPRIGHDVFWRCAGFDLLPQLVDKYAQIFRLLYALCAPHRIQQDAVGQHPVRTTGHINKQIEFLGSEMDLFAGYADGARL